MSHDALEQFGELLVRDVRDDAIRFSLQDEQVVALGGPAGQIEAAVKVTVDRTIHYLLWLVERGEVTALMDHDGTSVDLADASDGLSGEIYSPDGWIARFSEFGPHPGD